MLRIIFFLLHEEKTIKNNKERKPFIFLLYILNTKLFCHYSKYCFTHKKFYFIMQILKNTMLSIKKYNLILFYD